MTLDDNLYYHNTKVYSLIPKNTQKEDIKYWLGILNSNLFWWFLSNTGYVLRGGYFCFKTKYMQPFPIKTIDFSEENEKSTHDQLVDVVDGLLVAYRNKDNVKTEMDKKLNDQKIKILEKQMNSLVYELYGITKQEILVIETAN